MLSQEDRKEIAHLMQVIVDADVTPKFNLLADELQIQRKLLESLGNTEQHREQVETEIAVLKAAYRQLSREVAELKRAN